MHVGLQSGAPTPRNGPPVLHALNVVLPLFVLLVLAQDDPLPSGYEPKRERFAWFPLGVVSAWSWTGNTGFWSRWV